MKSIIEISIMEIQEMFNRKQISVKELVKEYLRRIDENDKVGDKLNSILEINPDVLDIAEELDKNHGNYNSKLYGIPILLKDNIDTADGLHTSAGSLALSTSFASNDAEIVKTLRSKGVVILGKTNMTEFANHMTKGMKAGYSSRGGLVRSPYCKDKNPSGSSTGSAVAVSANFCAASFGTDTSGSIITPAIKNGIVGFRPSTGSLSQKGVIPISFTLDTLGPMTRTVMDSITIFSELTNTIIETDKIKMNGTRIGIDQSAYKNMTNEEEKMASAILNTLNQSGALLEEIKLPQVPNDNLKKIQLYEFKYSLNHYLSNQPADSSIRSLKDIIKYNNVYPEETLRYGQTLLLEAQEKTRGNLSEIHYKKILKHREKNIKTMNQLLSQFDLCIMFKSDLIFQYVGLPIITIPCGLYHDGMPFGICVTSVDNSKLLQFAHRMEQIVGYRVTPNVNS